MDVSRETLARLEAFSDLALKWTRKINLISKATEPDIWTRHIQDSLQLAEAAENCNHWVDLGSGGGFPGIVVAIHAIEFFPHRTFTLIESDQRKCAFLREAIRTFGAKAAVLNTRIESVPAQNADVVSARALAPLDKLIEFSILHRKPEGLSLFPKGAAYQDEILTAQQRWCFQYDVHPSMVSEDGVILKVRDHKSV